MGFWIIALIILALVISLFSKLAELVGGSGPLIVIIVILVIAYLAFKWTGVLVVIALPFVGVALSEAGKFIKREVKQHDQRAKETAQIIQKTQSDKLAHDNDTSLMQELNQNCYWLGCMNEEKWKKKLPNYVQRQYSTSFEAITTNFAKQLEQQQIRQNDNWFEPFKQYVLAHPGGSTVTKMLHEVNCPQLKMTHITPDGDLVNTWLMKGTKRVSQDVPPLFRSTFIREMNENVFTPTEYLKKLYGADASAEQPVSQVEEINFDDL